VKYSKDRCSLICLKHAAEETACQSRILKFNAIEQIPFLLQGMLSRRPSPPNNRQGRSADSSVLNPDEMTFPASCPAAETAFALRNNPSPSPITPRPYLTTPSFPLLFSYLCARKPAHSNCKIELTFRRCLRRPNLYLKQCNNQPLPINLTVSVLSNRLHVINRHSQPISLI